MRQPTPLGLSERLDLVRVSLQGKPSSLQMQTQGDAVVVIQTSQIEDRVLINIHNNYT